MQRVPVGFSPKWCQQCGYYDGEHCHTVVTDCLQPKLDDPDADDVWLQIDHSKAIILLFIIHSVKLLMSHPACE